MTASVVGVDWGTSHRRGYLVADGRAVAEAADAQGALAARGRYAAALDDLLAQLGGDARSAPVVMSGMVGSAFGWQEVPYLDTSVPLSRLGAHLARLPAAEGVAPRFIVPGYRDIGQESDRISNEPGAIGHEPGGVGREPGGVRPEAGDISHEPGGVGHGRSQIKHDGGAAADVPRGAAHVDVMRGEEMQLLGALALGHDDGWFVLPGTHSKWVRLRRGRIERFWTFMTGELYAALLAGGTLASAAAAAGPDAWQPGAFDAGLSAAASGAVTHALFGARARVVTQQMPAAHVPSYVSGVLVGAEWLQMQARWHSAPPQHVVLIGAPALVEAHARAAARARVRLAVLDPRTVYLAALSRLAEAVS